MTVRKATARLLAADGTLLGEGRAYIHLRQPSQQRQDAQGTLSLDWWEEAAPAPARIELDQGPTLTISVQSDRLSACVVGRILRYTVDWPGE